MLISVFETRTGARRVLAELTSRGFDQSSMSILTRNQRPIPVELPDRYRSALGRGQVLLLAEAEPAQIRQVRSLLPADTEVVNAEDLRPAAAGKDWGLVEEIGWESFPASDPPGSYAFGRRPETRDPHPPN
ncbi:MAG: hypothetical protein AB7S38_42005 [Vulcanimicrobiota bacterium]